MKTSDFDYALPPELIAQTPVEPRDSSRLLVVDRATGKIEHRYFRDIGDYLAAGDVLVGNNSRVIAARLFGRKASGGKSELLLLEKVADGQWKALVKGKRTRVGSTITIFDKQDQPSEFEATITAELAGATRIVQFNHPIEPALQRLGHTPLPPYIHQQIEDSERYQTIYAQPEGSAAAPTAGLHFTGDLLLSLRAQRVQFETVTLHVGLDTFQPVKTERVEDHQIHTEVIELGLRSAENINQAKLAGKRLVAVGTTSVRVLETAALRATGFNDPLHNIVQRQNELDMCPWKPVIAYQGRSDLFIYPGYRFRVVDALITNFHLPNSSLLMLVAAFATPDLMRHVYDVAIQERYRFFSFGDAMLIL